MINPSQIADVLESVAEYVDGIEAEKTAALTAARDERISKLAERYKTSTGESVPKALTDKLAALDPDTLDQLLKVSHNSSDSPESLGKPADRTDAPEPKTTKEAAAAADDGFLQWIIS